jgi:hypothetical protein
MNTEIAINISKFLHDNDFEGVDSLFVYNLWLTSKHFVVHDIADVLQILSFIKKMQITNKAFIKEALLIDGVK